MLIDTRSNLGLPALQFTRFFVVLVLRNFPPQLGGINCRRRAIAF